VVGSGTNMAYMTFETKGSYQDFKNKMDEAMWGIFIKDAPEGGYWELLSFTKFLSGFYMMDGGDIFNVLDKPHSWTDEYTVYKKFQKLVGFEMDYETLHTMEIWNFSELDSAMDEPNFEGTYFKNLWD
jgi:hypothetical protein